MKKLFLLVSLFSFNAMAAHRFECTSATGQKVLMEARGTTLLKLSINNQFVRAKISNFRHTDQGYEMTLQGYVKGYDLHLTFGGLYSFSQVGTQPRVKMNCRYTPDQSAPDRW